MKKSGFLYLVIVLSAITLIGFHAAAFGATSDCSSTCQVCHIAESAQLAHPGGVGTPVMCIECHQQNRTMCSDTPGGPVHSGAEIDIVAIACKGCHGLTPKTCGPYLSSPTTVLYVPLMHSGSSITLEPIGATPVLPPSDDCDSSLTAAGSLTGGTACTGFTKCGTTATEFTLEDETVQDSSLFIYWGDGTAITSTGITHSYANIGTYQVMQTVTNPCGYRSQKVYTVSVTGTTYAKGMLKIDASGTDGRKISYSVLNGSGLSITNGSITLDGSKSITLDAAANYSVKIGYASVQPFTDPLTYHLCDLVLGATVVGTCSNPLHTTIGTCTTPEVWTTKGQLITPVAVTTGNTTTVSLTNCN